jgi:phage-related protein
MAGTENDITTKVYLDVSDLSKNAQLMKREIRDANAEFKNATAGLGKFQDSTEGLQAKLTQLNRILIVEKTRLSDLNDDYEKAVKEKGAMSREAQELAIKIKNQSAVIKKVESDINKYTKSLDDMGKESQDVAKKERELEDATKKVSDGFTVAKGAIAGFIANGLTALVGATKNAISSVLGLADATREYRQNMATLETVADDVGVSTEYIRDKFSDMMGVFNDEDSITETLNNMLMAGFDESNIDAMSKQIEGLALSFKDTLKSEGISDSIQEWIGSGGANLTGNFAEGLERLGYNLEEVQLATAGMTDEQRRNYAIQLLSAKGMGEVSESYREQNRNMVDAQTANERYQQSLAQLGDKIEPVTTKIREGFTKILEKMLELVEGVDIEVLGEKIDKAFDKFVNDIMPKIVEGLQWILDNKDLIIAGIVGIGSAFLAWKVVGVITAVINAIKTMTTAQAGLNLVMSMNPIGLVITAIAGLVTAFIYLWKNCDAFREFWINLWENIKSVAKETWEAITKFFSDAWKKIKSIWSGTKQFFSDIWKSLKEGAKNAWEGIKSIFSKVGSFFHDTFTKAWDGVKKVFSTGGKIFTGIKEGIVSAFTKIVNGIIRGINKVVSVPFNAINKVLDTLRNIEILKLKPFSWVGNISVPKIPELAKGGIVDKDTIARIGEAGKEAVIPLERNTQGLKKIAKMVADELKASGGGMTINNTYNQTFANMPTTRYAMKKAMSDSNASWQLIKAMQGGV